MVNLEHKLTVDDLIVEYMMYKVNNGYEPSFLASEFMSFLYFFERKMKVHDSLHNKKKLFDRFFERKGESDWYTTVDYHLDKKISTPHMDMVYSNDDRDYLIKANYRLSEYDRSIINTYFMDNGLSKYDDYDGEAKKIRTIIGEYLKDFPKRSIDESIEVSESDLDIGKGVAALIISQIWDSFVEMHVKYQSWPRQCTDINKYLLDLDLAEVIEVKSIRSELLALYRSLSKRIAILYSQDRKLCISTGGNGYLAKSNYDLIAQGNEELFKMAFGPYKKHLNIDLSKSAFTESHEDGGIYDWDDDPDYISKTTKLGNSNTKLLVKNLDNKSSNK